MSEPASHSMESYGDYLTVALEAVRMALAQQAGQKDSKTESPALPAIDFPYPPKAIGRMFELFGLSEFERDVLLLCAGVEFDSEFTGLCAAAQGDSQRSYPTFGLALAAFPKAHWSALLPMSPLRHWQLIHLEPDRPLTQARLSIDERILHYLTGLETLDTQLSEMLRLIPPPEQLVRSHVEIAREIASTWSRDDNGDDSPVPVIQLCGDEVAGKRMVASVVGQMMGATVYRMPISAVPTDLKEFDRVRRLWVREAVLSGAILLLDCDAIDRSERLWDTTVVRFVEETGLPMFLSTRERRGSWQRPAISFDIQKPTSGEQRDVWEAGLGSIASGLNGQLDRIVSQFSLNTPFIEAACQGAVGRLAERERSESPTGEEIGKAVWDVCRRQARPQLDGLAQRIEAAADWSDLILPDEQKQLLSEISLHVRHRGQVYERWGFQSKGNRGLGVSTLFAGPSGTGKTMAAEVLARELNLDLYRIDLSAVVSKYIGETEKNLRLVFDAAEAGGAILLFDEADALFGKRSEVKDSHDRHANIEVSYLLQRMETYRGLAILTTNLKDSLDQAFLRRIRFVVSFPFPDETQRSEIWQRVFPADTPTEGVEPRKLARLNVAGGNIRNIALNAAFLAADAGEPVKMSHLAQAARREFAKMERTLTQAEVRDW